jgi:DNA-binding CsgD family transcriptional regulator
MADESRKLTEAQREALRFVGQGYRSKEIARQLGVTHYAVNRRIERAVEIMGAKDRYEAARWLMAEEAGMCERIAHEPLHLDFDGSDANEDVPESTGALGYPWPWLVARRGRVLTKRERLVWSMVGLPLVIMFVWGIFLSGVGALDVVKF